MILLTVIYVSDDVISYVLDQNHTFRQAVAVGNWSNFLISLLQYIHCYSKRSIKLSKLTFSLLSPQFEKFPFQSRFSQLACSYKYNDFFLDGMFLSVNPSNVLKDKKHLLQNCRFPACLYIFIELLDGIFHFHYSNFCNHEMINQNLCFLQNYICIIKNMIKYILLFLVKNINSSVTLLKLTSNSYFTCFLSCTAQILHFALYRVNHLAQIYASNNVYCT